MGTNTTKPPVIALDGPSGSGKGTIGQLVAQKLGWHFLDSGAIYRVLALAVMRSGVSLSNLAALKELARGLSIQFKASAKNPSATRIFLNNQDVSEEVRAEGCGSMASQIAALPEVREVLLQLQRDFCKFPGLVADGRDMGTVVFSDAELKIFLVASCVERARRRFKQLQDKGIRVSLHDILRDLKKRDQRDEGRAVAPLKPAADAEVIDATKLSINEVVQQVLDMAEERGLGT